MIRRVSEFGPQDAGAVLCRAVAPEIFDAPIAPHTATPQELTNTAWAFASLGIRTEAAA